MIYWMLVVYTYTADTCFAPYVCYTEAQHIAKGFPSKAACEDDKKRIELKNVISAVCYKVTEK